ncbi:MAG: hypothetical protein IKM97_03545 [Clostridia bacterium]|nr:hypothetical protein [Clostridia bacterium]
MSNHIQVQRVKAEELGYYLIQKGYNMDFGGVAVEVGELLYELDNNGAGDAGTTDTTSSPKIIFDDSGTNNIISMLGKPGNIVEIQVETKGKSEKEGKEADALTEKGNNEEPEK